MALTKRKPLSEKRIVQLLEGIANGNRKDNFTTICKMNKRNLVAVINWIQFNKDVSPVTMSDFMAGLAIWVDTVC